MSQRQTAKELGIAQSGLSKALKNGAPKADPSQRPGLKQHGDEATVTSRPASGAVDIPGVLREWGIDPDEWDVRDVKVNTWDALAGEGEVVRLRQLTLYLRKRLNLTLIQPAVHVPALVKPKPARRDTTKPRVFIVEGDHQAPYYDEDLDAAMTAFVAELQPDGHVFLGDTLDLPTVSRFADHPAAMASPQECIDSGYALLRRRAEAAPHARRWKLKGNHDWRIEGEQLARAERLYDIKPADRGDGIEQLQGNDIRRLLHLDTLGVELVTDPRGWQHAEVELIPGPHGLVVRHGWITGAKTAEKSLKERGRSIVVGHGHHRQHVYWWDPSAEVERQGAMCGAMCLARSKRFPHFAVCDDWLQGAITVTVYPDGEFVIDHARWIGGSLYWRDRRYTAKPRLRRVA